MSRVEQLSKQQFRALPVVYVRVVGLWIDYACHVLPGTAHLVEETIDDHGHVRPKLRIRADIAHHTSGCGANEHVDPHVIRDAEVCTFDSEWDGGSGIYFLDDDTRRHAQKMLDEVNATAPGAFWDRSSHVVISNEYFPPRDEVALARGRGEHIDHDE